MIDTSRQARLLRRFRVMMTDSGAFPHTITDQELLDKMKGETLDEKLKGMEVVTSLVAPGYWKRFGL